MKKVINLINVMKKLDFNLIQIRFKSMNVGKYRILFPVLIAVY